MNFSSEVVISESLLDSDKSVECNSITGIATAESDIAKQEFAIPLRKASSPLLYEDDLRVTPLSMPTPLIGLR